MHRKDLIHKVASKSGLTETDVSKMVSALEKTLKEDVLDKGEKLILTGFGTFKRSIRKAGKRRNNFGNGELIDIPEYKRITFTMSKTLGNG